LDGFGRGVSTGDGINWSILGGIRWPSFLNWVPSNWGVSKKPGAICTAQRVYWGKGQIGWALLNLFLFPGKKVPGGFGLLIGKEGYSLGPFLQDYFYGGALGNREKLGLHSGIMRGCLNGGKRWIPDCPIGLGPPSLQTKGVGFGIW